MQASVFESPSNDIDDHGYRLGERVDSISGKFFSFNLDFVVQYCELYERLNMLTSN